MPINVGDHLRIDDVTFEVSGVGRNTNERVTLFLADPAGNVSQIEMSEDEYEAALVKEGTGTGNSRGALTSLWGHWMLYAIPRIRSAVRSTRPLVPYPHQDDAVWMHMLRQPRLRFLLADEPGTGKTIMSGMYIAEAKRRALLPHRVIIVVPAHLVSKWIRDLDRFFGIEAQQITDEVGKSPLPLRSDVDTWVVSLDLYTRNEGVRAKALGVHITWSLVVFDEAHRLTPTSQYLESARQLARKGHHLLLLTATPHRGKEHLFQGLLNLLDEIVFPWSDDTTDYPLRRRPGPQHFLRRMKEDLKDFDGSPLFPPRVARTEIVPLTGAELEAYERIMSHVDDWYPDRSSLARSVYGKRAASSLVAARATLGRRYEALKSGRYPAAIPEDPFTSGHDIDDPEAWDAAEKAVIAVRSKDRRAEQHALDSLLPLVDSTISNTLKPAKWERVEQILEFHNLRPGVRDDQLLIFTEYTDTARWLLSLFANAGFSTELLSGEVTHYQRDELQRRFLSKDFQVLVSTDAGGEGIDLQSAHIMINWDIPWSLVRLEQRMGRLHRIGQTNTVVCHQLVSPETREGRVQEVVLDNFEEASKALGGQIFDLMDAVSDSVSFDYAAALRQAQQSNQSGELAASQVPDASVLIDRAKVIRNEASRMASLTDLERANERLARDRAQAINPVIVDRFLSVVVPASDWILERRIADGIYRISGDLPVDLGGPGSALIATGAEAVTAVREAGGDTSNVLVLGPVEDTFKSLAEHARDTFLPHLIAGAQVVDDDSLTPYHLFVYETTVKQFDGVQEVARAIPILIRYSAGEAFSVAWESVMNLRISENLAQPPQPAAEHSARAAADDRTEEERRVLESESISWAEEAFTQLEDQKNRLVVQAAHLQPDHRRRLMENYERDASERRGVLERVRDVGATSSRLIGWVHVSGAKLDGEMTLDPNSEKIAIAKVLEELEAQGFEVDDRQTAGVGYDLHAWHPQRREQRLVEVKGCLEGLHDITLTQGEWVQAQQRGLDYWLYVVTDCSTNPTVFTRVRDPAAEFLDGPKVMRQFKLSAKLLRQHRESL